MKIELRSVTKSYGPEQVLAGLSAEFRGGQIVALLGINGAGKSTLLGCLAGMVALSSGEIRFDGEPYSRADLRMRRSFIFVGDAPVLVPVATVLRNAAVHASLWSEVPEAEIRAPEVVAEWIKRYDLEECARKSIFQLSRGQAYKAAMVGVRAADPSAWLLDEPFASGMDARGMNQFRRMVTEAVRERNRLVVYSTQFPEIAARFADRVCVLRDGTFGFDEMVDGKEPERIESLLGAALGVEGAGDESMV